MSKRRVAIRRARERLVDPRLERLEDAGVGATGVGAGARGPDDARDDIGVHAELRRGSVRECPPMTARAAALGRPCRPMSLTSIG